jgi:alginate O-acetyltransferase complex protein AlgI
MVFSSSLFIYGFIPIFFTFYYCAPRRWRNQVILVASLLFYWSGAGGTIALLLLSVIVNQYLANLIGDTKRTDRQHLLVLGVILNLAALVYYKLLLLVFTARSSLNIAN